MLRLSRPAAPSLAEQPCGTMAAERKESTKYARNACSW
jgi:hypothetical protein